MNANELADELEAAYSDNNATDYMIKAATRLRQQQYQISELEIGLKNVWKVVDNKQAEIEALKAELRLIDELVRGTK